MLDKRVSGLQEEKQTSMRHEADSHFSRGFGGLTNEIPDWTDQSDKSLLFCQWSLSVVVSKQYFKVPFPLSYSGEKTTQVEDPLCLENKLYLRKRNRVLKENFDNVPFAANYRLAVYKGNAG